MSPTPAPPSRPGPIDVFTGLCLANFRHELVKGALNSFDRGQADAATSLGYTDHQMFRRVMFPQVVVTRCRICNEASTIVMQRGEPLGDKELAGIDAAAARVRPVCTAQRAKGYKPDGALFRYLIEHAGCPKEDPAPLLIPRMR